MASKQNDDLFNRSSKHNEGSLPLDFSGKEAEPKKGQESKPEVKAVVSEPVKKEMIQGAPAPIPHATQYSSGNDVGKSDLNGIPRKPIHHIPPPYKKSAHEQAQTQEVKETKPEVPASSPVVAVQTPVQEKIPEPPKPPVVAEQEVKVPEPASKPEAVLSPEPKPVPAPVIPSKVSPSPALEIAPQATKSEIEQDKKEPVKLQPKPREHKEEKKTEHRHELKSEQKVEKTNAAHAPHKKAPPQVEQATVPNPVQPKIHEVKPVKQEEKKEIPKSKKFNIIEKFSSENATSGQILQEGRVRMGMSIDQISITTKIKKNFIEAIERDDYQNLPAPVYVNAYVRSLCYLYKIDENQVLSLLNKAKGKSLEYTVPEEVIHHIEKGKQINIVQEIKVKRITLMLIAAGLILVAGAFVIYQLLIMNKSQIPRESPVKTEKVATVVNPNPVKAPASNAANIQDQMEKKLISPHVFTMSQLPLPEQR
ncbi:MAG: helix-turn-helix domain-containing protein [Victivallales bacterium]